MMMTKSEWALLFQMFAPEDCDYALVQRRGLSSREIVKEFDSGRSVDSIASQVHRSGGFKSKQLATDYVRKCLYDDLCNSVNYKDSGVKL